MNKIVKYLDTRAEVAELKKQLALNDIMFAICKESYIATVEKETEGEYMDFNNEIPNGYFRDCFFNANSTILFVCKTDPTITLEDTFSFTCLVANVWYAVLSEYLPLDRFGSKVRTIENKCAADFISDITPDGNTTTIGYINVGSVFEQPNYDNLVNGRDLKDCCCIDEQYFEEIMDKVFTYLSEAIGG